MLNLTRTSRRTAVATTAWLMLGIVLTVHTHVISRLQQNPVSWFSAARFPIVEYGFWILVTPAVLFMARRFSFSAPFRVRWLATHLAAVSLIIAVHGAFRASLHSFVYPGATIISPFLYLWFFYGVANFLNDFWIYATVAGGSMMIDYYRMLAERSLLSSQLEAKLAQAELQALKMQLHPHFLFNSLNTIATLMYEDVRTADEMMSDLADFLRVALVHADIQEISLQQELEFLGPYLRIQQKRFHGLLSIETSVTEEAAGAYVPYLLLQPLIENAVKHGFDGSRQTGSIEICAQRTGRELIVIVQDSGVGLAPHEALQPRVGLSNIRSRLERMYGDSQSLEFCRSKLGGLAVTIRTPYRPVGQAAEATA